MRVFATEIGEVRLGDLEQLEHHRGHPAKVAGARAAFQALAHPFHVHVGAETVGIDFRRGRGKQVLDAQAFEQRAIGLQPARVLGEIFVRAKLLRVDENRDDHRFTLLLRCPHQRKMALVQGAHRGNEADQVTLGARLPRYLLHPFHRVDRFHATRFSRDLGLTR